MSGKWKINTVWLSVHKETETHGCKFNQNFVITLQDDYIMTLIIWIKSYISLSSRIILISGVFILTYRSGRIGHILAESDTRFYR